MSIIIQLIAVKMEAMTCPKCEQSYSPGNPPKILINCPHTLCLHCLQTEILCPVDHKRIERRKYTLEGFHTDQDLLTRINTQQAPNVPAGDPDTSIGHEPAKQFQLNHLAIETIDKPNPAAIKPETPITGSQQNKEQPQQKQPQFEVCLLHSKPADLICLEDHCLICANCGLFGEHRSHRLLPYQQFALNFGQLAQRCLSINEHLQQRRNKTNNKLLQNRIEAELSLKREQESQQISSFITELHDQVRQLEKHLVDKLEQKVEQKRREMLASLNLSYLEERVSQFSQTVEILNNGITYILNHQHIDQLVDFVDPNSSSSQLAAQGQQLVADIDRIYRHSIEDVLAGVKSFTLSLQKPLFSVLEGWTSLKERGSKKYADYTIISPSKPKNTHDQILISQNNKTQHANLNNNSLSPIAPVNAFDYTLDEHLIETQHNRIDLPLSQALHPTQINLPSSKASRPQNHCKTVAQGPISRDREVLDRSLGSSVNRSICSSHHTQKELLRTMNNDKYMGKRRKKLELPDKYAKIYDELQKDNLDVLDLGGAFLGDATVCAIVQLVPSRTRLKAVKLMNNKLTDEAFPTLVQSCKRVSTLNLSYNSLTEKALEYIEQECNSLGYLENITLSHNKIVLRSVKDRIEALKRIGIKVSL